MKTLLAVLITMSFTFSTQSFAQADTELLSKINSFLDDADELGASELGFKKIIVVNALDALASSNIKDKKLIKRVVDSVDTLEQALTRSQRALVSVNLRKLENR